MARRFGPVLLRAFSALAALLSAHPAAAQPISADRVRAWFEAEFARAGEADLTSFLRGREFRYRVEWHTAAASSAEMEKWRSEIKGRPDHPSRQRLEEAEIYLRDGPNVQEIAIWYHSPGRWRRSRDSNAGESSWWDVAADKGHAWSWVPEQLRIVGPDSSAEEGDYASDESDFINNIKSLLFGGLNFGQHLGVRTREVRISGDRWAAVTAVGDGPDVAYEYEGRWDEAAGRGYVDRVRILAHREAPEYIGYAWMFSGWRHDPLFSQPIAGRVEERQPGGRIEKVVEFDRAESFDMSGFSELVAVPSLNRSDPIRGELRVTEIYDYRPGQQVRTAFAMSGEAQLTPLPGRADTQWLRHAGWAVLILLAAGLVGIRLLQHRRLG